ncbi:phage portal protein [uncultured Bradyrhizobium sp.]|uniref:portal protein n=1 Tax=uncultured Bradyrhizobium sp. TaxID=199684 RepID=UPI0035C9EDB1
MPAMNDEEFCSVVAALVKDAEHYREDQSTNRTRAMEYYDGTMLDTPSDDGRSKVVSRDVRGELKKVLPSIVRVILGGDKVVEYIPVKEGDEQSAQQATDYVNYLAFPESEGPNAVHDSIYDALLLRNGILKWWQDERIDIKVSTHSGLNDNAFAALVGDDAVDVLEHTATQKNVEIAPPGMSTAVTFHDVKIRRRIKKSRAKMAAVPLDNFLIHPDAITMLESPLIGEGYRVRRSDLVAMGYDREMVNKLPVAGSSKNKDEEETTRRRDIYSKDNMTAKSMEEIEYYDLLVRIDYDDDGIAELRRLVFAGGLTEEYLLENEEWDDINYADIVCERRPHQWEGNATSDDAMEIQRIKTVLLRQTLDNLYWQNNLQDIVQEGAIINPESVTNPAFGLPIRVSSGTDVRGVITTRVVPFIAEKSFAMLTYLDEELHDRTGISDASGGMAPDALQNVTAKASAMIEQAGIGQTEMMVRTIANCLKPAFRGLLKLIIQHQDQPRTVRLRGKWEQFDPRTWNVDMDATVNTGLGAGTRERDMLMMGVVTGLQEKLLTAFGPDNNLYVKPEQLYNGIAKTVEASGLKSVDQYFSNPKPEDLQAYAQAKSQQPSPEQEKTQGAIAIEQVKGQVQVALADKKMQVEANKEREQRDADLVIKQAELEKETQAAMHQAAIDAQANADKLQVEREKIASQERIKLAEIEANIMLERERMDREDARAVRQRADAQNAQFESEVR